MRNFTILIFISFTILLAASSSQAFRLIGKNVDCLIDNEKLSHEQASEILLANNISLSSFGDCHNKSSSYCTSLDQINCATVCGLLKYSQKSMCNIIISGGTEEGHFVELNSHANGFKVDMKLSECHDNFIRRKFQFVGKHLDGTSRWQDPGTTNEYKLEGNHWNVLFRQC